MDLPESNIPEVKMLIIREASVRGLMESNQNLVFLSNAERNLQFKSFSLLKMKFIVYLSTWIERGLFPLTDRIRQFKNPYQQRRCSMWNQLMRRNKANPRGLTSNRKRMCMRRRDNSAQPDKAGDGKKYEPCPRWKNLRLTFSRGYAIIPLVKYCQPGVRWWGNSLWKDKTAGKVWPPMLNLSAHSHVR